MKAYEIINYLENYFPLELQMDFDCCGLQIGNKNKEIKKESWYKLTSKLNAIAINPISGNIDETGIVYWFRKGTP